MNKCSNCDREIDRSEADRPEDKKERSRLRMVYAKGFEEDGQFVQTSEEWFCQDCMREALSLSLEGISSRSGKFRTYQAGCMLIPCLLLLAFILFLI